MKKKLKPIPKFKNEDEEREFWSKEDSSDSVDWSEAIINPKFPSLKFSGENIPITPEMIESNFGFLGTKGKILKALMDEKKREGEI